MGKKKETKPLIVKAGGEGEVPEEPKKKKRRVPKLIPASLKLKLSSGTKGPSTSSADPNKSGPLKEGSKKGGAGSKKGSDNPGAPPPSTEQPAAVDPTKTCPLPFGVRSYLHHFYETVNSSHHPSSSASAQEEDFFYLIHPKGRKCGALWFKMGLIMGATLFLLGAIAIVIGYAIPKQDTVIGRNDDYEVVDKDAVRFNRNLDICKLIGLAGFCSGGLVLVISLLAPTFTSAYWDEDPATEPFRVSLSSSLVYENEPKSPIPATEKINPIQPIWSQ